MAMSTGHTVPAHDLLATGELTLEISAALCSSATRTKKSTQTNYCVAGFLEAST